MTDKEKNNKILEYLGWTWDSNADINGAWLRLDGDQKKSWVPSHALDMCVDAFHLMVTLKLEVTFSEDPQFLPSVFLSEGDGFSGCVFDGDVEKSSGNAFKDTRRAIFEAAFNAITEKELKDKKECHQK